MYYARFIAHFLHDMKFIPCREPFKRFLPVGLVLGQTFVDSKTGQFVNEIDTMEVSTGGAGWDTHY